MSNHNHKLPLGLLLKSAGLISDEQLQNALKLQAKYTQMKLGEILVLQEDIKAKTVDFFADKWQEFYVQGKQFPIGYYLKKACLLNEQQIQTILKEQENTEHKFGAIAIKKGWIGKDTLDFFLTNLSVKPPQILSLVSLEEYNRNVLQLEKKYHDPSLIMSRVLAWTGGNSILTKAICHVFAESNFNIPAGSEISAVDRFVESSLVKNWQTSRIAAYIRTLKHNLVNNQRCLSNSLLKEYRKILLAGSKEYRETKEQDELLILGLVVREREVLRVANLIYQRVFDQNWLARELDKLNKFKGNNPNSIADEPKTTAITVVPNSSTKIEPESSNAKSDTVAEPNSHNNTLEPITKMGSLITLAAIGFLIPLFLTIDNYYASLSKREPQPDDSLIKADELQKFCDELDFVDSSSSLSLISQIERKQRKLLEFSDRPEAFPRNCEVALNRLRVLSAPRLGRESRVLEAIGHLCKIPADSEVYVDAEVWLERWYNSPNWGRETKFYLEELTKYNPSGCPAAHFTEYES